MLQYPYKRLHNLHIFNTLERNNKYCTTNEFLVFRKGVSNENYLLSENYSSGFSDFKIAESEIRSFI
jgi:hypothetical protein